MAFTKISQKYEINPRNLKNTLQFLHSYAEKTTGDDITCVIKHSCIIQKIKLYNMFMFRAKYTQ